MEDTIRAFLEANRGRPKVIILGEDHGGQGTIEGLRENVGKELTAIRTIQALGQPFIIYSELPAELVSRLTPAFTAYYLQQEAGRLHIPFKTSKIGAACREVLGSCDDLYEADVISYLDMGGAAGGETFTPKSELVVAALGLLHATDMTFPESIAVLRINCASRNQTQFALSELRKSSKKYNRNTANKMESNLSYINDPAALALGESTVPASAIPPPRRAATFEYNNNSYAEAPKVGSFKPEWVKNREGNWVAKCPICGSISGTTIQALTHNYDCPNKDKSVDVSEKPATGGRRKTKRRLSRKKTSKRRRTGRK
jgi:hypothetical protein